MACSKVEYLYQAEVGYFERPIMSNKPYKYVTLHVGSPYDIYLQLDDEVNAANEAKLGVLLQQHLEMLKGKANGKGEDKDILPPNLTNDLFYEGMPLLVKIKDKEGLKVEALARGEVVKIKDSHRQEVDVCLVDEGGVISNLKWECDLLPMTRDLLRVPKLGISCTLGMITPEGGNAWQKDRDWEKDFLGNKSQIVTFLDYYPDLKSYEVAVEVDKVNVGLKYFHDAVAQPIPLNNFLEDGQQQVAGRFPAADYTGWVGLKVIAYGMKVFRDEKDGNKIKVAIQIQPDIVKDVQTKIEAYLQTASDQVKGQPFDKYVGSFCLAKFGDEYFRSTILKKEGNKFLVQYVDYKDEQLVGENEMIKLPESLQTIQEGGAICQLTDLMSADYQNVDKLKEILENQDLYAVVDACDSAIFGSELLVSLFQPTPEFNGIDTPLADLLELTENQRPPLVREILQTMELIPETWAHLFLQPPTPTTNKAILAKLISVRKGSNPWDSAIFQFIFDAAEKESELTWFYENGGCDSQTKETFMQGGPATGTWIAAKAQPATTQGNEREEGEISEEDAEGWLRAKVVNEENGKIKIFFVDHGRVAWVEKKDVFPLHKYYCKDPLMTIRVGLVKDGYISN